MQCRNINIMNHVVIARLSLLSDLPLSYDKRINIETATSHTHTVILQDTVSLRLLPPSYAKKPHPHDKTSSTQHYSLPPPTPPIARHTHLRNCVLLVCAPMQIFTHGTHCIPLRVFPLRRSAV